MPSLDNENAVGPPSFPIGDNEKAVMPPASISPSSDGFTPGAGFSRIPRPDDGQESEFEE